MSKEYIVDSALEICESIEDKKTRERLQGLLKNLGNIENYFNHLCRNTFTAVYSIEKSGSCIQSVSEHWLEAFGYEENEVMGHSLSEFVAREFQSRFENEVLAKCISLGEVKKVPLKLVRKNQELVDIVISGNTEKNSKGKTEKIFFLMEDLTQLRKAENTLREQEIKKQAILSAIQTPLKESIQKLSLLKKKLPKECHEEMETILNNLSNENLLQPYFSNPNISIDIDVEINKWLIAEYSTFASSSSYFSQVAARPLKGYKEEGILHSLHFDAFDYLDKQLELVDLIVKMFKHFHLLEAFKISEEALLFFLHRVKSEYRNVPYHNFLHAFDVTQMTFYFLTEGGLSEYLTDLDILALLISSVSHDVCHPGLNNNFQERTSSILALTYNDQSILENHHISSTFQIIHHFGCNLLENLSVEAKKELRKMIISNILATDMKRHFEILTVFSNRAKKSKKFDGLIRDDRMLLMKMALKCSDVCNPARPYRISERWSGRVMEEFFHQGDLEKAAGIKVSSFMDREKTSIAKCQTAFIEFIAKPLYGSYFLVFPEIRECIQNMEENSKLWHKRLLEEKSKEIKAGS